jgi:hypothetical protein
MIDLHAIDADFLTRFIFAFVVYWLWGILKQKIKKIGGKSE